MITDFSTLNESKKYSIMSNTIFPRPIAWITTEDEGIVNLAPFSYFAPLSSEPPLVIVSIGHKENGEPKDTLANIMKSGVCTINFAHKELLEELKNSAEALPKDESECEKFNIKAKKVLEIFPPMVADAKCALFCEYVKSVDIGSRFEPIILKINHIYIADENIDEKNHIHLENIGRVGMEYLIDSTRVK
ncbi:flavin reductase family protein [Sulfurimonas sp.]|uniref:flavin reductase family protein n=1 Tax=Sulfurimonas sp. TaxID=2022749 RepID=UPI00356547B7